MIRNIPLAAALRSYRRIAFGYIKQRDIEQAENKYGTASKLAKIKGKMAVVKLICVQSFRDARTDYKRLKEINKVNWDEREDDQQIEHLRIQSDLVKAIPAFAILNAPGGAPFFFAYIMLFPNLAPTWVLTEHVYNSFELAKQQNRLAALQRFRNTMSSQNSQSLAKQIAELFFAIKNRKDRRTDSVSVLRDISSLLVGKYTDGTYYLCKYSPLKRTGLQLQYFIHPLLSRYLLIYSIHASMLNNAYALKEYRKLMSFEDRLYFLLQLHLKKLS